MTEIGSAEAAYDERGPQIEDGADNAERRDSVEDQHAAETPNMDIERNPR
jgi:hypothetical protein